MIISNYITPVMNIDPNGDFFISLFIGTIIVGLVGGISSYASARSQGDDRWEAFLHGLGGALVGGSLGLALGTGAALACGVTIGGLSAGASVAVGLGISIGVPTLAGGIESWINQSLDNGKINWSTLAIDAGVTGLKGLLNFGVGAWTGGAGLWNIPQGTNSGLFNLALKIGLNTNIGGGLRFSVDTTYKGIKGESFLWAEKLRQILGN